MSNDSDSAKYRTTELERKVAGLQRQVGVLHARLDTTSSAHEKRIRDLEIKVAVQKGIPQKRIAEIYDLSPGRVCQIVKRVA